MLLLAFVLSCGAAAVGGGLAVLYLQGPQAKRPAAGLLALHAGLGAASLAVLLTALRRGPPHTGMGTAGFGPTAASLLATALLFGLWLALLSWRRRRAGELLVFVHAGLAITGVVVLLALVA
ncbi:MAG TPA: hypothetical protein VME41_01865, partial [Stellaceae bacterium]|nr:hypothetical protein [Stellaceae bacterium]